MEATIIIEGTPGYKERVRLNRRTLTLYTPSATKDYEKLIGDCFQKCCDQKFEGALSVSITAVMPIPKSVSKKVRQDMLSQKVLPTKKPDIDNIIKIIFDGLNGIAFDDDKQIVEVSAKKIYGARPQVVVAIKDFEDGLT